MRTFMYDIVDPVCNCRFVRARVCNQSRFGTLQEVINSQDYCADTKISKVLHNSLCGKGWLNQSTWKGERDVRFAASCRGPSASLSAPAVSLLCEKEGVWTSKSMLPWRQKQLVRDLVKGGIEENPPFHDTQKIYPGIAGKKGHALCSKDGAAQRGTVLKWHVLKSRIIINPSGNSYSLTTVWHLFFWFTTI